MKRIIVGVFLVLLSGLSQAQNGLENVIVEKYYVSNSADSVGSVGALPAGSVTYRIYVDMLPGYKFQAAYGVGGHPLTFSTTTSFFNNEDRGATTPTYTKSQARANSVMLDSWLTVGGACVGNFGILKSEDDVALGGATVINNTVPPILQNNDPSAGLALTVQDGLYLGAIQSVTFVGFTAADLDIFDAVSNVGNLFTTTNASWASLNGSTGPIASTNKVLIAQITTNGVFHYELNIQIGTPTGGVQNFVAQNPTGAEITIPSLMGTLGGSNVLPTVSITSPSNGASFLPAATVAIAATAADADGSVASVEFFVDGNSIGTDNSSPFTMNYTAVAGNHSLTARATDNLGGQTTSSAISISVVSNPPPSVNITAPANGSTYITGTVVAITATATDNGSVASVEFFIDGNSIGIDNTSPYSINYTSTAGAHAITARATDNLGAQTTSSTVNISVGSNMPPVVSITAPLSGALVTAPAVVPITADATDPDGNITLVEFYVNGALIGSDATSPYSFNWTSVIGSATITVVGTDNLGAHTTSAAVVISVADPNIPYKIISTNSICVPSSFCLPVNAISTVQNVIGYDIVLNYDKNKVSPTGVITVGNSLITPSYVDVMYTIDSVNGHLNISLYFNGSAPSNAAFSGTGNLFCAEFTKTAGFTSVDSASFSISTLQESYINGVQPKTVDPGKYITYRDSTSSSYLKFWLNGTPLNYNSANPASTLITNVFGNNVSCTNKSLTAVQPDINGMFSYNISNGQDITIERDISGIISVQPLVNGFDALLVRKALIQDPTFVPSVYQMMSMDVNLDGRLSAGDVSQINQRAVLMIPEFKQAWNYSVGGVSNGQPSKDWLFIDSATMINSNSYQISATFPLDDGVGFSKDRIPVAPFCLPVAVTNLASCPQFSTETYFGVLLGDINGNFNSVGSLGTFRTTDDNKIVFDFEHLSVSNDVVEIPVFANSKSPVNAVDFSLTFDESKLRYDGVTDPSNSIEELSNFNEFDRTVRFTSNSINQYDLSSPVVYAKFHLIDGAFSPEQLSVREGFINGERVRVQYGPDSQVPSSTSAIIYPNPASSKLNILNTENADLMIFDSEGRKVVSGRLFANSLEQVDISALDNGIYLVKLVSDHSSSVSRVVINK